MFVPTCEPQRHSQGTKIAMAEEVVEAVMANGGDFESKIKSAMQSRIDYFNSQADSLKLEGVRRLLENDLGIPEFSLDSHKSHVKELLVNCLNRSAEAFHKVKAETTKSNELIVEGEEMNESPVMGLLQRETTQKSMEAKENESDCLNEKFVKKSLWDRASYIQFNCENVTLSGLRRFLEEDLNLEKFSLDPFKKFISKEIDEILNATKELKTSSKKDLNGGPPLKKTEDHSSEEVKPSKKSRKRINTAKETNPKKKVSKRRDSNDSQPNSSAETSKTKKDVSSTQACGQRVENLKSVLKSCSLKVPPAIYRKVNQLSESQREIQLVKEMEAILAKEGLSPNPSDKEIKEVKRRKERAKDLEGIDMSNIVSSSRRRSSYVPLKEIETSESESDSEEEEENDDKNEEIQEGDDNQNNERDENGSEEGDNRSKNEETKGDVKKDDVNETNEESEGDAKKHDDNATNEETKGNPKKHGDSEKNEETKGDAKKHDDNETNEETGDDFAVSSEKELNDENASESEYEDSD